VQSGKNQGPVRAAFTAISAVSKSRNFSDGMMLGSCAGRPAIAGASSGRSGPFIWTLIDSGKLEFDRILSRHNVGSLFEARIEDTACSSCPTRWSPLPEPFRRTQNCLFILCQGLLLKPKLRHIQA